jgi:hypothetical protein
MQTFVKNEIKHAGKMDKVISSFSEFAELRSIGNAKLDMLIRPFGSCGAQKPLPSAEPH